MIFADSATSIQRAAETTDAVPTWWLIVTVILLAYIAYRLTRFSHSATKNQVEIFKGFTTQFQIFKQELRKELELRMPADEKRGGKFGEQ